jgi:DNA-binding CsgD family transcriptional regulator
MALRQVLTTMSVRIVVAAARDWHEVAPIVSAYQKPVLLVATSLLEALTIADQQEVLVGKLTEYDAANRTLFVEALTALGRGEAYVSPAIATPFVGLEMTMQQQRHLLLEAQQYPAEEIARQLGIAVDSVYQYRRRLCDKLRLQKADELVAYARKLLERRERNLGE